ncbi:diguanylate cyclase [Achromobacter sp. UMC71]|uniref:GGDEF domain-containing protein n=1 Tax=Achromobacter sp. UMC71 TaxID=1862320 RepID=UPI001603F300|nr:GGDEF domain-containing protein [Achromobacter sp. UMC71]MBB1626441.1 diguanylate cyclase [Achromobacter sp. UMC71]
MSVDLLTLYFIIIGTLLVSAGLTFWEHRTHPSRSRSLRVLAAGFATLAAGCTLVLFRADVPSALGSPLSNLVILSGYLLVLNGVASLSGRRYRTGSLALLAVMALIWLVAGAGGQALVWKYVSAFPIALVSAATAWELWRCESLKAFKTRYIAVAVSSIHALVYVGRAMLLPGWVAAHGPSVQVLASNVTMYEGVLYSVILPMALIKLIREETLNRLVLESQTDYLTRLGNRRWFFEQGARAIDGAAGHGQVAVLAFDLDQFKAINDRHGHQAGDQVLKAFARIVRDAMGPKAILARIGGEEFAALLVGEDAAHAQALGDSAARRFAETIAHPVEGIGIRATVSIGLAHFAGDAPPLADALARADQALYRAKALGGNRLEPAIMLEAAAAD